MLFVAVEKKKQEMFPISVHDIEKGCYVILNSRPCLIKHVAKSKTGKHGHLKCVMTGEDVFNGDKILEMQPGHIILQAFDPVKLKFTLCHIDEDVINVLDDKGKPFSFDVTETEAKELETHFWKLQENEMLTVHILQAPLIDNKDQVYIHSAVKDFKTEIMKKF